VIDSASKFAPERTKTSKTDNSSNGAYFLILAKQGSLRDSPFVCPSGKKEKDLLFFIVRVILGATVDFLVRLYNADNRHQTG